MIDRLLFSLLTSSVFLLVGCNSQVQVSGTVTANGTPVEDGSISFQTADGQNANYGAPITKGQYTAKVKPGKYVVLVVGGKGPAYPKSQEDLAKVSDEELRVMDAIPADAKGNSETVDIAAGQVLDIKLQYSRK